MDYEIDSSNTTVELAASIIAAYVANNHVAVADLPAVIASVYSALTAIGTTAPEPVKEAVALVPAVPIKKSITPDYIICLEDGRQFKSLKRHLRTSYNMTADEYRTKWGLPSDYPMVASTYSAYRTELAKKAGLGRKRNLDVVPPQPAPKKAGRGPKKVA